MQQFSSRAQGSLEFILIFAIVSFLVGMALYLAGALSTGYYEDQSGAEIDDFAESIRKEAEILQKVEPGYTRELMIPNYMAVRFNISLQGDYLIVTPSEIGPRVGTRNESRRFYSLAGKADLSMYEADKNGDGLNETYVVMTKLASNSTKGLALD